MRPILGMLQTSKLNMPEREPNFNSNNNIDNHLNMFETLNDESNTAMNTDLEKNPIINKRILLKVNGDDDSESSFLPHDADANGHINNDINARDEMNAMPPMTKQKLNKSEIIENGIREKMIFEKKRLTKSVPEKVAAPANELHDRAISKEGRIVVYGDSNCLDATHTEKEKSCFWLLDALLEYTMTSHVSGLLKDLNRSANIRFDAMAANQMPKRLPNNNLHLYSKVLMPMPTNDDTANNNNNDLTNKTPMPLVKRPRPECRALAWETPIFLNISAPNDFQYLNGYKDDSDADASNMVDELNLRRKLESQKGEVCSD